MGRASKVRTDVLPRLPSPEPVATFSGAKKLALFACALNREGAMELLGGLGAGLCEPAQAYAQEVLQLDSVTRQTRLTKEFGLKPDAERSVRGLWAQCGLELRNELWKHLPPHMRVGLSKIELGPAQRAAPAGAALVRRLLLEATR